MVECFKGGEGMRLAPREMKPLDNGNKRAPLALGGRAPQSEGGSDRSTTKFPSTNETKYGMTKVLAKGVMRGAKRETLAKGKGETNC